MLNQLANVCSQVVFTTIATQLLQGDAKENEVCTRATRTFHRFAPYNNPRGKVKQKASSTTRNPFAQHNAITSDDVVIDLTSD